MQINYALNTNELDSNFLEAIKLMFKDKNITILIRDDESEAEDFAFGNSIEEGLSCPSVSRDALNQALYAD